MKEAAKVGATRLVLPSTMEELDKLAKTFGYFSSTSGKDLLSHINMWVAIHNEITKGIHFGETHWDQIKQVNEEFRRINLEKLDK